MDIKVGRKLPHPQSHTVWEHVIPYLDRFESVRALAQTCRTARQAVLDASWVPLHRMLTRDMAPYVPPTTTNYAVMQSFWAEHAAVHRNLVAGRAWRTEFTRPGPFNEQQPRYTQGWTQVAFSRDATRLLVARRDNSLVLHDLAGGSPITHTLPRVFRNEIVFGTVIAPDAAHAAVITSHGPGGQVAIFDPRTGAVRRRVPYQGHVERIDWSPDGSRLAVINGNGRVTLHRVDENDSVPVAANGWARQLAWSPDNQHVSVACQNQEMCICDAETGARKVVLPRRIGASNAAMAWSPDSQRVACAVYENVYIYDADNGTTVCSIDHPAVGFVCWSPNGLQVATTTGSGYRNLTTMKVSDASTGVTRLDIHGQVHNASNTRTRQVAWSPTGLAIGVAYWCGTVHVVSAATGETWLAAHHGTNAALLAWNRKGTALATGHDEGTAEVLRLIP